MEVVMPRVTGRWSMLVKAGPLSPAHVIGIEKSSDGTWLAFTGAVDDRYNERSESERFSSFDDALRFIGWPVELVPPPHELAKFA